MLRHVVVFRWSPETRPEQVAALRDGLAALPGLVPEIRAYAFGSDAGLKPENGDFAVVADFDDVDGYRRYADNPDHRAVVTDLVAPIVASRSAVQFEID
jgi:hypothetical protein